MGRWDYHVSRGPSFVGITDEQLAAARSQHPRGRVLESVDHLARAPGDDETDHIMRHRYGVDPATYRATVIHRPSTIAKLPRAKKRAVRKPPARRAAVKGRAPEPRLVLSRLVRIAIKESPGLASTIDRLVTTHLRKGGSSSRVSFIGFPLTITSTSSSVRVAFASER